MIFLLLFISVKSKAEMRDLSTSRQSSFSYEVVLPENQIDKSVSYFDLKMVPGQEQVVQIILMNSGNESDVIEISVNNAKTNGNGVIEYGPNELPDDESQTVSLKNLVEHPKEVVLEPGETRKVEFLIKMPEKFFEGYLAGGIRLMPKGQQEDVSSSVVNQTAYIIGLLLSEQSLDEIEKIPEQLKFLSVSPGHYNFQNAFLVDFSNAQPIYMDDITTNVQIISLDTQKLIYEAGKGSMRMAPNSRISFPVSLEGEEFVAGQYEVEIKAISSTGSQWIWNERFTVTQKEADRLNELDVYDHRLNFLEKYGKFIFPVAAFFVIGLTYFRYRCINPGLRKKSSPQSSHKKSVNKKINL